MTVIFGRFVYSAANLRATTLGVPVRRIVNESSLSEILALANEVITVCLSITRHMLITMPKRVRQWVRDLAAVGERSGCGRQEGSG